MSDPRACEVCGLISMTAEYIKVHTTNGSLRLCRQCLDDINRKNPEVGRLRSTLADAAALLENCRGYVAANYDSASRQDLGRLDAFLSAFALAEARSS